MLTLWVPQEGYDIMAALGYGCLSNRAIWIHRRRMVPWRVPREDVYTVKELLAEEGIESHTVPGQF